MLFAVGSFSSHRSLVIAALTVGVVPATAGLPGKACRRVDLAQGRPKRSNGGKAYLSVDTQVVLRTSRANEAFTLGAGAA
jgi:hypothetical protein